MRKLLDTVDEILKWSVIIFMGANVINVLWQVFTRFVMDSPSTFTEELARYLLIWVSFLGAAYVGRQKMHIAIDVFKNQLSERNQIFVNLFIQASIFFFSLFVLVIGGYDLMSLTFQMTQISPALQINLGYVYMVMPISGILFMFYSSVFFVEHLKQLRGEKSEILNELEPETKAAE